MPLPREAEGESIEEELGVEGRELSLVLVRDRVWLVFSGLSVAVEALTAPLSFSLSGDFSRSFETLLLRDPRRPRRPLCT